MLFRAIILSFIVILKGCSSLNMKKKTIYLDEKYSYQTTLDYKKHFTQVGQDYLSFNKKNVLQPSRQTSEYIEGLAERILVNNRMIFSDNFEVKVYFIKNEQPFHFSAPSGSIFLSTALINRYVSYEDVLIAILAGEILKSGKLIYEKKMSAPVGAITYKDMEIYNKLSLNVKNQLNQWSFYVLKRSGVNPLSVLRFLQIKNKNFLDFVTTNNVLTDISREETLLKTFLVKNQVYSDVTKYSTNSSTGFYKFKSELRRKGI